MVISRMLDGELREARASVLALRSVNTRLRSLILHMATHDPSGDRRGCEPCEEIKVIWRNAGKVVD